MSNFQKEARLEGERHHAEAKQWLLDQGYEILKEHYKDKHSGFQVDFMCLDDMGHLTFWEAKGGIKPQTAGLKRSVVVARILDQAACLDHWWYYSKPTFNVITTAKPNKGTVTRKRLDRAYKDGWLGKIVVLDGANEE